MVSQPSIKQVAVVSPYDLAASGGVTEHVRQLAHHLRTRNIDVTIIAPCSDPHIDEPDLISLGPVTPIPINGSVARTTVSPAVIESVGSLLARRHFDIIHLHEPFAPMLPLSVLNASSSANVGTFHASGERSLGYAASRKFVHWLARRLTQRIAVSQEAAQFVRRYIGGEYTIIPNGVDTRRFRPDVPPIEKWQDGRPNVLFVGRFEEPRKGFGVLLEAWPTVQQARPDARLVVVGRGDPEPFRERAADLGCHEIHFVGSVERSELPRYYRTAQVFCAPSTGQESFGIVLVEAMSSGTPVIASDINGYRQVLHHRQEGLLTPRQQPPAVAAAILHVLGDPALQHDLSIAGRETAQQYAWEKVTDRVIEVYEHAQWLRNQAQATDATRPMLASDAPTLEILETSQDQATHIITGEQLAAGSSRNRPPVSVIEGDKPMLPKSLEERVRALTQRIAGATLGRSGISPNVITAVGLALTLSVTWALAAGYLVLGGILVLITSAFDMLDGALARATNSKSSFGAFFDSTVDRYTEALILLGLLVYYQGVPNARWEPTLIYLGIVGSLMVSYTRARAEALGFDSKVGLLGRPERIILLSFGLLVGWLTFALAILAIFTNVTTAQRIYHVWRQDRRRRPRPIVTKAPRRGWFAPRDQSPS